MKKTKKAFTLIEVLFAIALLSLMAMFLLPAARSSLDSSSKIKDTADTTYVLQEAIETSRGKEIGNYTETINGKNVEISVEKYVTPAFKSSYKKIKASFKDRSLELIEAYDEEGV